MSFVTDWQKRRALKAYVRQLPGLLERDYGKAETYSPKQIRSTVERSTLNVQYLCYGLSMYSVREVFDAYHREVGETCDYDAMRQEIADTCFSGNRDFTPAQFGGIAGSDADGGSGAGADSGGGGAD